MVVLIERRVADQFDVGNEHLPQRPVEDALGFLPIKARDVADDVEVLAVA